MMPFGRAASLYEMYLLDKRNEREVREWLLTILSYVAQNRTTRLVYSHPYNIELYPGLYGPSLIGLRHYSNVK